MGLAHSSSSLPQEEKGALLAKLRQAASHSHDPDAALVQHQPAPPTHAASQHAQPPLRAALQQTAAVNQAAVHEAGTAPGTSSEGLANRQNPGTGMVTEALLV